jgi:plastocyanin
MKRSVLPSIVFCLLAIISASPGDDGPTTAVPKTGVPTTGVPTTGVPTTGPDLGQTGTIEGSVRLPTPQFASQMVLYLEPGDGQTFAASSAHATISQKGARFSPSLLVVCVHRTVDFLNDEARPIEHNVFSNSPTSQFDLGLFQPGEKRSVTFDKPGPVLLYCSIHRHMDGVVYVTPTPFFDVIEPDGTSKDVPFHIAGVPPGKWIVHTWQRRRRYPETSSPSMVRAGATCMVDLQFAAK